MWSHSPSKNNFPYFTFKFEENVDIDICLYKHKLFRTNLASILTFFFCNRRDIYCIDS